MRCVLVLDKPLVSPLWASDRKRLVLCKIKTLVVTPGGLVSVGIGAKLRTIRQQWQLSLREVEERSLRFAQEQGDKSYQVSASWLVRLEREDHELTVTKLRDRLVSEWRLVTTARASIRESTTWPNQAILRRPCRVSSY